MWVAKSCYLGICHESNFLEEQAVFFHCTVYSSCVRSAMLHASETWPLTKPSLQRLQRYDRAMIRQICNVKPQDTANIRSTELLAWLGIEDLDLILREGSAGMDTWNAPTVQSRQPLIYRLLESVGLGGPRWLGSSWQRRIAVSGSSQLSTLMIETPGDLVWDVPCVQQASYLEGGLLLWILPLYLHVNKKSDDDDDWNNCYTYMTKQNFHNAFDHMEFCLVINLTMASNWATSVCC